MAGVLDSYLAIKFVELITKPFEEWDAYEMGLIDDKGEKIREPKTSKEKDQFRSYMNLVRNLKKMMDKFLPGSAGRKLASFASALYLIKEDLEPKYDGEAIINTIIENLFEADSLNESKEVELLDEGLYELNSPNYEKGAVIRIKAPLEPHAVFLGEHIYKVTNLVHKDEYYVLSNELRTL